MDIEIISKQYILYDYINQRINRFMSEQVSEVYNYKLSAKYQQLLQYIGQLLKRQNMCGNTYLYKQMKGELILPLYTFLDEKNISKLHLKQEVVIDAIEESGLAKVFNNREVKLLQFPTIKINIKEEQTIKILQAILEEKGKKYILSKRPETAQFINLTIFSENIVWLQKLVDSIGKQIDFQRVRLLNDMTLGVDRIRKLKFQHAKKKTVVGKVTYSLSQTPQIFIRRALESSDSEEQSAITMALGKNSKKQRKVKQQKVINKEQQFPELF